MILVSSIIFLLIETFVIFQFGNLWGFWPTVAAIFSTAFGGGLIIRHQGLALILKVQRDLRLGYALTENLIVGACIVFAAVLLIIPGFVTDLIGFLLLLPIFRRLIISTIRKKMSGETGQIIKKPKRSAAPIIEGVYNDVTENRKPEIDGINVLPPKD